MYNPAGVFRSGERSAITCGHNELDGIQMLNNQTLMAIFAYSLRCTIAHVIAHFNVSMSRSASYRGRGEGKKLFTLHDLGAVNRRVGIPAINRINYHMQMQDKASFNKSAP